MASPLLKLIFEKLSDHASMFNITLSQFWNSDRLCIEVREFLRFLDDVNFTLEKKEKLEIKNSQIEFITLETVLKQVQFWADSQGDLSNFLSKKSPVKQKSTSEMSSIRMFSKNRIPHKNYLLEHHRRNQKQKQKLQYTMQKTKNESDYELTVKVGELNDICKKLKNGINYIINTKDSKFQIIEICKNSEEKVIPLKIFERKYEAFKQASLNEVEEFEGTLEEDLKKVFAEVMCLSDELQSQIKLLEQKGILN